MPAILSRFSILFINYISCDLNSTKILLYKLFVQYLVVKLACVNAELNTVFAVERKGKIHLKIFKSLN